MAGIDKMAGLSRVTHTVLVVFSMNHRDPLTFLLSTFLYESHTLRWHGWLYKQHHISQTKVEKNPGSNLIGFIFFIHYNFLFLFCNQMGSSDHKLHIFFFPLMAHGHMIPIMDMVKLFASRGVKATIITTPLNVPFCSKSVQKMKNLGVDIGIEVLKFPSTDETGLPEGCENTDGVTSLENAMELVPLFFVATTKLQEPLEKLLEEYRPDCLVADMFFPWATDAADKFGIPRLVFHGTSYFALSASECVRLYEPHKNVSSDSEPFIVPNLPGNIKLTRHQLPDYTQQDGVDAAFTKLIKAVSESELKSFGTIANSFYELEPAYADFYRQDLGRRAWHIGPVSLCNRGIEDKAGRGKEASIDEHECLKWLDSKESNSVVYICFGSMANFTSSQLKEIAVGLEASGQPFIWVVRKDKKAEGVEEDWLPERFEERMKGKGLIIRGWAPQVLILDHEAIGGFITHCGWNSTLEGIAAGKPLITWPLFAEQFYNEKLVTEVLKIGVSVCAKTWARVHADDVKSEAVQKSITRITTSVEAEEMRRRAKNLRELAKNAVAEGGSSYLDFNNLIEELRSRPVKQ